MFYCKNKIYYYNYNIIFRLFWGWQERLANIHVLYVTKVFEVTQHPVTVANIGFKRSVVILRVDCETMRIIGAESVQVKLELIMATLEVWW